MVRKKIISIEPINGSGRRHFAGLGWNPNERLAAKSAARIEGLLRLLEDVRSPDDDLNGDNVGRPDRGTV